MRPGRSESMARTAVLYARVSTRGQAENGYSLRQQIEALRGWAEAEGYEISEEIEDAGYSGVSLERPGLDRVRDLVAAGGISVVIAQDRDRFAREPAHLYLLRQEFAEHGTKLRALNDRGDDSPEGELTDGILDQLAKFERAKTVERSRRGKIKKVREGKLMRGPRPPYGFRYAENGPGLVVEPSKMRVVRRIFEMLGAEGLTMGEVQRRLNDEGTPSPMANDPHQENSGLWHKTTIRELVLNPLYKPLTYSEVRSSGLVSPEVANALDPEEVYGLWTWGRYHQRKWRERGGDNVGHNRYEKVPRPKEEWLGVPIPLSTANLSRANVDAAGERISGNTRRPPSTMAERFWQLSGGIVYCKECGGVLSPKAQRRPSGKVDTWYLCRRPYNGGPTECTHRRLYRAYPLEEAVWKAVRNLLSNPERVKAEYDRHIARKRAQLRGDSGGETREIIAKRLEKLERRRSGYIDLAADGDMSREELRRRLANVDEQREAARKALREVRDRQETIQKIRRDREMMLGRFSAMRGMDLLNISPENRRQVLQALRIRAEVDKGGNVRISGVFDADITELLPMAHASADEPYTYKFHREIPPPHPGVLTSYNRQSSASWEPAF
jgi:site-specific DNA recombinase